MAPESVYALIDADLKAATQTMSAILAASLDSWEAECPTQRDLWWLLDRSGNTGKHFLAKLVKKGDVEKLARIFMTAMDPRDRAIVEFGARMQAMHRLLLPDQFWHQVGVALGVFEEKEEKDEQDHQIRER